VRGPFASEAEFLEGTGHDSTPVAVADLLAWSPNGAFPLLPDARSQEVFMAVRSSPRLDLEDETLGVRGLRE
jgi:hypothetical protein